MVQFNKMMVMVPVMLAARKLDAEDPNVVYWLRVAYLCMQSICIVVVVYTYLQASKVSETKKKTLIYVPPPAMPFADPNAKKKYTETSYGAHILSTARSLLGSTLFGICLTTVLHYYKGMLAGLAIQTVMAPLNLAENPVVKALFLGQGLREEDKIFEEKTASELTPDDEVVDGQGNTIPRNQLGSSANRTGGGAAGGGGSSDPNKRLEEIMLDTWDAGAKADLTDLMNILNKKNCNHQTQEDNWTPLMLLSGLGGVSGTTTAIRHVWKDLGADPALTDKEGWNAAHWAAFHGSEDAAKELRKDTALLKVKDKEGNTPIDTARKENNNKVASLYEEALGESKKSK